MAGEEGHSIEFKGKVPTLLEDELKTRDILHPESSPSGTVLGHAAVLPPTNTAPQAAPLLSRGSPQPPRETAKTLAASGRHGRPFHATTHAQ